MKINFSEQRELADYIAHKLAAEPGLKLTDEKHIAAVVWDAIEDYTADPDNGADMLHVAKEHLENLPDEAYDPHDFVDIMRYE